MKRICLSSFICSVFLGLTLLSSCTSEVDPKLLPVLSTTEATKITEATAQTGGNITSDAGYDIIARGVCWSTSPNPTIKDSLTLDAAGSGAFISKISRLTANTTYYVRAYATNKKGTAYGLQVTFTTKTLTLTTNTATTITVNSAVSGGEIKTTGDSVNVLERGICWNTQTEPTITNNKTSDGIGAGKFTSTMTNLAVGTKYYVRAYIKNTAGVNYGNEINFTTLDGVIALTTTAASSITATSATIGGTVPNDGGSPVTERGLCISKLPNPSIENKMVNGAGNGSFATNITGLTANTTYYVRAYATNSVGTSYGNEITFTTLDGIIALSTTAASSITATAATIGGSITADGGATISARGFCWSKTPNPTIADGKSTSSGTIGSYATNISGLSIGATYYVRAYATNSVGTCYGNEISFTTLDGIIALSTTTASSITATSATISGSITSDGGVSITARGFCWSKTTNPTIADGKSTSTGTIGTYATNVSGLSIGTTYYVRAYATNSIGTCYGNEISFTTLDGTVILTSTNVSTITAYSAKSGGNINSDGGGVSITERGICWSTSPNPTIGNSKVSNGIGMGIFSCNLLDLNLNTTYYVRAYAINSVGIFYGNEINFTTQNGVIILTTTIPTALSSISAISGGNITSDGGGVTVTNRGICWSTSTNPTIELNTKISNSSGLGSFTNSLSGLIPNTTYYLKSFATNTVGTFYGNELSFITPNRVTDIDGNIYNTVIIGTQVWMVENLKTTKYRDGTSVPLVTDGTAWGALTTNGCCYYNNDVAYNSKYGLLYNWFVVNNIKKIAPLGWHIPTDTEWGVLTNYLGGLNSAGGKLKEIGTTHWTSPNTGATNESGFTALPGGIRSNDGNYFLKVGNSADWWSSTEYTDPNYAMYWSIDYNGIWFGVHQNYKQYGFSIRCIKD